jgi:electron transport complex protein RnfG
LQGEGPRLFAGYDAGGRFLGVVIEASERGYADVISAMYAYDPDKKVITGFKVIDMKETPGLGNRIGSDPEFTSNFKELDASEGHPITTVKHGTKKNPWEIDAISGATISSRAVGRMLEGSVHSTAPVVARNLDRIERGQ